MVNPFGLSVDMRVRRFLLGSLVGFSIMAMVLVALHAEPLPWPPRDRVAIPLKVQHVTGKCIQMGFQRCPSDIPLVQKSQQIEQSASNAIARVRKWEKE